MTPHYPCPPRYGRKTDLSWQTRVRIIAIGACLPWVLLVGVGGCWTGWISW